MATTAKLKLTKGQLAQLRPMIDEMYNSETSAIIAQVYVLTQRSADLYCLLLTGESASDMQKAIKRTRKKHGIPSVIPFKDKSI